MCTGVSSQKTGRKYTKNTNSGFVWVKGSGGFIFPAQTARGQDPSRVGGDTEAPDWSPWASPSPPEADLMTHLRRHHASGRQGSAPPWGGNAAGPAGRQVRWAGRAWWAG